MRGGGGDVEEEGAHHHQHQNQHHHHKGTAAVEDVHIVSILYIYIYTLVKFLNATSIAILRLLITTTDLILK